MVIFLAMVSFFIFYFLFFFHTLSFSCVLNLDWSYIALKNVDIVGRLQSNIPPTILVNIDLPQVSFLIIDPHRTQDSVQEKVPSIGM